MSKNDPIQAQLVQARRAQILQAAGKVFAAKGFHNSTIKDVAKEAGIADGTIYNYFENKTDLMLGLLDQLNETDKRGEDMEKAAEMDMREWAKRYIQHRYTHLTADGLSVFAALLSEVLINDTLREVYVREIISPTYAVADKVFQKWIDEGLISNHDPAIASRVGSAAFFGLVMLRLIGDPVLEQRWEEVMDFMTEILLKGLLPDKGKEDTNDDQHDQRDQRTNDP
jgi:TetR/AcrR family fatty acid metabolism transcriptional regulator